MWEFSRQISKLIRISSLKEFIGDSVPKEILIALLTVIHTWSHDDRPDPDILEFFHCNTAAECPVIENTFCPELIWSTRLFFYENPVISTNLLQLSVRMCLMRFEELINRASQMDQFRSRCNPGTYRRSLNWIRFRNQKIDTNLQSTRNIFCLKLWNYRTDSFQVTYLVNAYTAG